MSEKVRSLERMAIEALEALADQWPETLALFSWNGRLCVITREALKTCGEGIREADILADIDIPNDGGDPMEQPQAGYPGRGEDREKEQDA